MGPKEAFLFPVRGMRAKLLCTIVAALGIIACMALVIVLAGFSDRLDGAYRTTFDSLARSISITKSSPNSPQATGIQSLSDSDVQALTRELDPNLVSDVIPIAKGTAMLRYQGVQYRATVTGATPDYLKYKNTPLYAGTMFTQQQYLGGARVVLVGKSVGKALFGGDGSAALGSTIFVGRLPFRIIGMVDNNATGGGGSAVVAPITTVRGDLLGGIRTVGEIGLMATTLDAVDPIKDQVSTILERQHTQQNGLQEDFSVDTFQAGKSAVGAQLLTVLFWVAVGLAAFALLIGLIGLALVLKAEVAVRAAEAKAVVQPGGSQAVESQPSDSQATGAQLAGAQHGRASRGSVAARLLGGSVLLAVLAGLAGVAVGIGLTMVGQGVLAEIGPQYGMPYVSAHAVALAIGLSVAVGVVAALLPAIHAGRTLGRPATVPARPLVDATAG